MLDHLKKFKTVVNEGSFTKAANKLNISQPAISISIDELERLLDGELLIRSKSGITTTELGNLVYKYANDFEILHKNLINDVSGLTKNSAQEIKFGAIDNFGMKIVERIIPRFQQDNNELKITFDIDNSTRLIDKIEKQELNFAFITKPINNLSKSIKYESFAKENFITFSKKGMSLKETINFIGFNQSSYTFKLIDQELKKFFKEVNYTAHSSSPDLILRMVLQGRGVTSLPENLIDDETRKEIKIIKKIKIQREIGLIKIRNLKLSRREEEFIEQVREQLM